MENNNDFTKGIPTEDDRRPFSNLEDSPFKGRSSFMYEVAENPEVVVRKSFVSPPKEEEGHKKRTVHENAEYLRNTAIEFKNIIENIGIRMAKTDFVIGRSLAGTPAIFGVSEKIDGENLDKIAHLDKELADKVDGIYSKIIGAMIDSFLTRGHAWHDLKNEQFVYGKTAEDEKPDVYLVDIDPIILDWDDPDFLKKRGLEQNALFWWIMGAIEFEISSLEYKVDGGKRYLLSQSREMIARAHREVPQAL